jgi:transposase-like protein
MPKSRPPYPAEFRQQIIELAGTGKTPAELSREFGPTTQTGTELQGARDKRAKVEQRRSDAQELHRQTATLLQDVPVDEALASTLETMRNDALGEHQLTVESCDNREQDVRTWLQARIDAEDSKMKRLAEKNHQGDGLLQGGVQAGDRRDRCQPGGGLRVREPADATEPGRPAAVRGPVQGTAQRQHDQRDRQLQRPAGARARDHQGTHRTTSTSRWARSTTTPGATSCW